jgi:hypothetical protein
MSGPIVRRYGFPNFEKIFGERELKHGAEGEASTPTSTPSSPPADPPRSDQGAEPTKDDADRPKP